MVSDLQYTAEQAVSELAASGVARADVAVRSYLDRMSEDVGVSVYGWGLDESDLAAIEQQMRTR